MAELSRRVGRVKDAEGFDYAAGMLSPDDHWAIDGTVLNVGEGRYFIWSGWPGENDGRQDLYICRMLDPMLCDERRVLISKPTLDWERIGSPKVNEGPQVLIRGGFVHCIYSASHSTTDHYCLGRLTARLDSNLLDPRSWTKHPEPVFSGANGIISPGHASFVGSHTDERQGDRDWIIYHCARNLGAGWDRYARAQVFDWKDDVPIFGELASPLGRSH